jgi:hypothetical protein
LTPDSFGCGGGFLDQVNDSSLCFACEIELFAVPEDVCVPREAIEQYRLRPGQKLAG